jgi:hypothetical protein
MTTWKKIDDSMVLHIWKCDVCGKIVTVNPDFYGSSGIPLCSGNSKCEGNDLTYLYTKIEQ